MAKLVQTSSRGAAARTPGSTKRSRSQDRGPRTEYLVFRLAGEPYAAPVEYIREILKPPALTYVPRAPGVVMGIISVRGQVVTVIDLRRRLSLEERPTTGRARILLADTDSGETIGLFVDEVLQVYRLADTEIERAQSALGADVSDHLAGIARPEHTEIAGGIIILLDLKTVLGHAA